MAGPDDLKRETGPTRVQVGWACARSRRLGVAYFEHEGESAGDSWRLVHVNPLPAGTFFTPGGEMPPVGGAFMPGHGFEGCPNCGSMSFIKCAACGRLSCWDEGPVGPCGWCSASGPVAGRIESLDSTA